MSSSRRPWYPWYPKDFNQDEKVKSLSDDAELLYRRALDVMWQANDQHLLSNCQLLLNQIARGWQKERFQNAWNELIFPGFELLKTTEDGKWVYSKRLCDEAKKIQTINIKRKESGKKGGLTKAKQTPSKCLASAKQTLSHTYTYTDIKEINKEKKNPTKKFIPPTLPEVIKYFSENGYKIEIAKKAFEYYSTASWKDSKGNQVRNWKQKMISVWFTDENRETTQSIKKPITMKDIENGELERNPSV